MHCIVQVKFVLTYIHGGNLTLMIYLQHPLCIVCDTSVLLTHLDMISKYKDNPIQGVGQPVFLFPWTVLQELDRLCSHTDTAVLQQVNRVVEALRLWIRSEHGRILFQAYNEVSVLVES